MKTLKDFLKEEGEAPPAGNSVGDGAIAGLPPDDPAVQPRRRVKKKKKKKE